MVSACALIIGDEILTGKVQDENSVVLARVLFERGVRLVRIETIADNIDDIARTVRRMSEAVDYVFTSGGIGPTHDDKTYEGVAKAFDQELAYHQPTLKELTEHHRTFAPEKKLNDARKKMALLPESCEVLKTAGLWVPLVVVKNVYVLPGIPGLFSRMLEGIKHRFEGPAIERILIYTHRSEGDIAAELEALQRAFPEVAIGSYPKTGEGAYQVMVSFEGTDGARVHEAARKTQDAIDGFYHTKMSP